MRKAWGFEYLKQLVVNYLRNFYPRADARG